MKKCLYLFLANCVLVLVNLTSGFAQTSWRGTTSTNWTNAANWTAGVPNANIDAIIGDANFTGLSQPTVNAGASCRSLTIGGTLPATLNLSRNLTISGSITINSNGSISHGRSTLSVAGNWINNGSYATTSTGARVNFSGVAQTLGGSSVTAFRKATVNAGSVLTLTTGMTVSGGSSSLTVNGTINPGATPTYLVTASVIQVNSGGRLLLYAATFAANYNVNPTLAAGSIVEYASSSIAQTVSNSLTYSTLTISGTTVKSLTGNLPGLNATTAATGNVYVNAGTLDLSTFTANRAVLIAGGTFQVNNGATLRIGGTNTFPANYNSRVLQLTSTVQYAGTNQTILSQTYGNLELTSSAGAIVKSLPGTAFTVEGNFASSTGAGTSVSYTAASAITVRGSFNIGSNTTFNGSTFSHSLGGNWINEGTFTGSTSTITMSGVSSIISGAGIYNINNLTASASGISVSSTNLTIAGNLLTNGPGQFTHSVSSGTVTMNGPSKTISGTGITFANLTISGTVSSSISFTITGNLAVSGGFSASAGTVTMNGTSKTISGAGSILFYNLAASGTISTAVNFSIGASLDVSGSFTATAGTATFTGVSSLNGTANLFNVTLNATSLRFSINAVLGVANTFTITSGTLDVTTAAPNTVNYNGSGAQTITATTYDNLTISNGGTKTAVGAFVVNRDLTIAASTTLNAGSFVHQVRGNWINNGTFTASTGTITFTGTANASIAGATTFNTLIINKTSGANIVTLNNDVAAPTVNMTSGTMHTGTNTITITVTRTGNGIILGNIRRTHIFVPGTAYAFEGPDNTITFTAANTVSTITVSVTKGSVGDFPSNASINRQYTLAATGGYSMANLRLHYEVSELNGNTEATMQFWKHNGSAWVVSGKTGNSVPNSYVEQTGLAVITNRWTCADNQNVLRWNGGVSTDWNTAANWTNVQGTPSSVPTANDIVELGTGIFPNQPSITSTASAKSMSFGSAQAVTLNIASGSLVVNGNINGNWSANTSHTINVNNQSLTVNGDLSLSDGVSNHVINLNVGTGTISITGSLIQRGGAAIAFSGAGNLNIADDFNYTSGTFTAGSGTVSYNGSTSQTVAPINYNHVVINKSVGIASVSGATTIAGNLNVSSGELNNFDTTTINGNVTVATGAIFRDYSMLYLKGNWTVNGTYTASGSSIFFDGLIDQNITASSFNVMTINKASGRAILSGNVTVNSNLTITSGTLDLQTYSCNRITPGGTFSMGDGSSLLVAGTSNFPSNYTAYTLAGTSTVTYNGSVTQNIAGINYGHLTFANGGVNTKTLTASAIVAGNITNAAGATFHSGGFTIELYGNWINGGNFTPSTGTVILQGISKTITGNIIFNRLTVNGTYSIPGTDITCNGLLNVTPTGSFDAGSGTAIVNGDLTNSGSLTSSGTTTFTGTTVQTLRLINAITSTSTGVVNFNGNVSPVLNSTTSPSFAILNINNTAGVNASAPWLIYTAMNVNSGGIFNGGISDHFIFGNFANAGTATSAGNMSFTGPTAKTVNFGSTGFSSTGHVTFSGSGQITVMGTPGSLANVTISNTNSAGITPSSNWNLAGDLVIASNSIFHASSYSHIVGGNLESNGTLNGGTSTFTMTSAVGELTGSATTTFNHFVISGLLTAVSDFNVAGSYTNNGTYDGTSAILSMTGSSAATISASTTPSSLSQLQIAKSGGAVVSMNVNLSDIALLYIQSGVLFTSTFSITQDAGGGFLLIDDGATLRLGGTNSLPGFSGYSLDANSNVEYSGTTQSIGNAAIYGNLLLTAAGNKNAIVPFITLGNFTLSNGTLTSAVSVTHTIGGNWLMSGGTFNNTNIAIVLNGTNDQDISSTGSFNNLTINKLSGIATLSSNVTVNGILNFTAGKVSIGNSNLTIGTAGSITNANANNYIIAIGSGTLNQRVANGSNKVFPVGLTNAYTPATIALTAGSTADVINVRMLTAALHGGMSGSPATSGVVNASWVISETVVGGSNATVTLQWPSSLELPGFVRSSGRLAHFTSSAWEYGSSDIAASGTDPYSISRSGFTNFSPFAVSSFMALPVTWINISARNEEGNNIVSWVTGAERNNDHYVIESSTNGNVFNEIGRTNASGNSNFEKRYTFIHHHVTGQEYYYRIKQVDIDGHFSYSKVVRVVTINSKDQLRVLNNPVHSNLAVSISVARPVTGLITISDASGKLVLKRSQVLSTGNNVINLGDFGRPSGMYYLSFTDYNGNRKIIEFVKK